jgi:hypothetical protein
MVAAAAVAIDTTSSEMSMTLIPAVVGEYSFPDWK